MIGKTDVHFDAVINVANTLFTLMKHRRVDYGRLSVLFVYTEVLEGDFSILEKKILQEHDYMQML